MHSELEKLNDKLKTERKKNDDKHKEINSLKHSISECEDLQKKFEKERNEAFDLIKIKDAGTAAQ